MARRRAVRPARKTTSWFEGSIRPSNGGDRQGCSFRPYAYAYLPCDVHLSGPEGRGGFQQQQHLASLFPPAQPFVKDDDVPENDRADRVVGNHRLHCVNARVWSISLQKRPWRLPNGSNSLRFRVRPPFWRMLRRGSTVGREGLRVAPYGRLSLPLVRRRGNREQRVLDCVARRQERSADAFDRAGSVGTLSCQRNPNFVATTNPAPKTAARCAITPFHGGVVANPSPLCRSVKLGSYPPGSTLIRMAEFAPVPA